MRVLEYAGFDPARVRPAYERVVKAFIENTLSELDLKKLRGSVHPVMQSHQLALAPGFYRARLGYADRLLFSFVRDGAETCVLMLEVIFGHDYQKSRFLRGAAIEEEHISAIVSTLTAEPSIAMRYLHPKNRCVYWLDKPLSFDDSQTEIFNAPAPMVLVGSAGSGKTALTLEKLKTIPGDVLYVTHSSYLASNARDKYFATGDIVVEQNAEFLSYREFLETLKICAGTEVTWPMFYGWFQRIRQAFKALDAHQLYEEIRGVICAQPGGVLSRADYLALGVRQSIFTNAQRSEVFDVFERYLRQLEAEGWYELSLLAHERLALAAPRYDFVVIDEVQDLTIAQLAVILKTLKLGSQFLLCGDSNQIVHPNFFSWAQLKSLFWRDPEVAQRQSLRILRSNFRNANATTELANRILKIKHARFGSIDKESNYLVEPAGQSEGVVQLLAAESANLKNMNELSKLSTHIAVLVLRDEDKPAARLHFKTPLLFSIHEAKGLEYEHIILFRMISDQRAAFAEIASGVTALDIANDTLNYSRAKDKSDKALEIYKFFVNALYVGVTRAVKNIFLIESDLAHPLIGLLDLQTSERASLEKQNSSAQDWQREARRLELFGKQEQADAIRRDILKTEVPPWPVYSETRVRDLLVKTFIEKAPGSKHKQQLLDYASFYRQPALAIALSNEFQFGTGSLDKLAEPAFQRACAPFAGKNFKDVLEQCRQFGMDFRTPMNTTPLMMAALAGNMPLIDALVSQGADLHACDAYGRTALHLALARAFTSPEFAKNRLTEVYRAVAPSHIDVQSSDRLWRIDQRQSEYFLFQTMFALTYDSATEHITTTQGYDYGKRFIGTEKLLNAWRAVPIAVLSEARAKRSYISSVLARNEVSSSYASNRALFVRVKLGRYALNPKLLVRTASSADWQPLPQVLNYNFLIESTTLWRDLHMVAKIGGFALPEAPLLATAHLARECERVRKETEAFELRHQQSQARIVEFERETARLHAESAKRMAAKQRQKLQRVKSGIVAPAMGDLGVETTEKTAPMPEQLAMFDSPKKRAD